MANRIARVWSGTEWVNISSVIEYENEVISYSSASPAAPLTGETWIDSSTNIGYFWSGNYWNTINAPIPVDYINYSYFSTASNIPSILSTQILNYDLVTASGEYTLKLSDAGKIIFMNGSSAQKFIIPANSTASFAIGTKIDIVQVGAGTLSASAINGVSLYSEGNKKTFLSRYCMASLIKIATDSWNLVGGLT